MKRLQTILMFGAIFAAALGTVMVNDQAISAFIAPAQYESNSQGILMQGHVEYVVRNSEGNIVQYAQGDNMIVQTGGDCIATEIFFTSAVGACSQANATWEYIAIGNSTSGTIAVTDTQLNEDSGEDGLAAAGTEHTGEMARKLATVSEDVSDTFVVVTIANTGDAFSFTGTLNDGNATTIEQSALFSQDGSPNPATGETTAINGDMLAAQDLATAVTVANGDTLTVTWTVTIGTG